MRFEIEDAVRHGEIESVLLLHGEPTIEFFGDLNGRDHGRASRLSPSTAETTRKLAGVRVRPMATESNDEADTVSAHVHHVEGNMPFVERKEVKKVTGELIAWQVFPGKAHTVGFPDPRLGSNDCWTLAAASRSRFMRSFLFSSSRLSSSSCEFVDVSCSLATVSSSFERASSMVLFHGVFKGGDEQIQYLLPPRLSPDSDSLRD